MAMNPQPASIMTLHSPKKTQTQNQNLSHKPVSTSEPSSQPNPAWGSLKRFGGMVHDTVATGLNYANPVTFTKNLWQQSGQLPSKFAEYDRNYGNRVRQDLARRAATPKPQSDPAEIVQRAKVPPPAFEMATVPGQKYDPVSPYTDSKITAANYDGPGPYQPLNRAELHTEDGVPYFDNTYMKKRYGESVYQPRTEQQRLAEGNTVRQRLGLSPVGGSNNFSRYDPQNFDDLMDLQRHQLDVDKQNNVEPHYMKQYDDMGNITGEQYSGYFDPRKREYTSAPTQAAQLAPDAVVALDRAKQAASKSPEAQLDYLNLLKDFGLNHLYQEMLTDMGLTDEKL